MKHLKKISLAQLNDNELEKDEQKVLCGGCIFCSCGCEYAGPQEGPDDDKYGGSSKADNDAANDNGSWW